MTQLEKPKLDIERTVKVVRRLVYSYAAVLLGICLLWYVDSNTPHKPNSAELVQQQEEPIPEFQNGFHVETGLKEGEHLELVIANCTGCHSADIIIQNRATREGWLNMIRWMQETQKLWDLSSNEDPILDYLAANYYPEKKGRRAPLTNIEWYELED